MALGVRIEKQRQHGVCVRNLDLGFLTTSMQLNKTEKPFSLQDDEVNDMNDKKTSLTLICVLTISTFFLVQCKLFEDDYTRQFFVNVFNYNSHLGKQPRRLKA